MHGQMYANAAAAAYSGAAPVRMVIVAEPNVEVYRGDSRIADVLVYIEAAQL
jgi:hypothetical protein